MSDREAEIRARLDECQRGLALANACIDSLEVCLFGTLEGRSRDTLEARVVALREREAAKDKALREATYLAERLFQMVPREVWREHGAEFEGHYEGDYRAEQVADEIKRLTALASPTEEQT